MTNDNLMNEDCQEIKYITIKKLSEQYKIDFYQLISYIEYLNIPIETKNNIKTILDKNVGLIDRFISSYTTNQITYIKSHNIKPFFDGILLLDLRKKYNLNEKQFKNKCINANLEFKYIYSDKECEIFDDFMNDKSNLNRAELRDLKYIKEGWIPLRNIIDEFGEKYDFSINTGKSIINLLNIDVYKPSNNLSFINKEQKNKIEDFLKGFNSAKERRLYFQEQTCQEKYGVNNPSCFDDAKNKISEKVKLSCTDERQKKIEETKLKKYGKRSITDSEKMMKSRIKNGTVVNKVLYRYNNLEFASSWELYYYIYQKEILKNNIQKGKVFEYEYDENTHYYFCDFLINDENIEIKGNQFLDEYDNLKQMKNREWDMCKQKCMEENNVKIISKEEIKPIIRIIKNKFGNNFIKQFRIKGN